MLSHTAFATAALFLTCLAAASTSEISMEDCKKIDVKFLVLDNEATFIALEDDIRKDLEQVGVNVVTQLLEKEAYNAAILRGDFDMVFSETWGPPYDPHSFVMAFSNDDEPHSTALQGLPEPLTQSALNDKITETLTITDEQDRQKAWTEILTGLHEQAVELPFSGKRIPAVINKRLSGYTSGHQQFDYPLHSLRIESGSTTITVAPGGQTGLFAGVGRLDPHTYRPNEFFSNNWVYEGLVEYGADGRIEPSLATSWTVADEGEGHRYTFTLRQGVQFHDGEDFNCAVAKLNFDHVFAEPLTTIDWHGWYGLPQQVKSVTCTGTYELVLTTKEKYYPLLQELTYIRPLRMLSPAMFVGGITSDPFTQNSCHSGWGTVIHGDITLECVGALGISGTGRWVYEETISNGDEVQEVVFSRNPNHWANQNEGVQRVRLLVYENHAAVKAALLDGSLDAVVGDGVLDPEDIAEFRTRHTSTFNTYLTGALQNRIVILNTARPPLSDITVRKTIIHAVNKAAIIDKELFGLAEPVNSLFPKSMPYSHIDLTPRWDYDREKAMLLNCAPDSEGDGGMSPGTIAAIVVPVGLVAIAATVFAFVLIGREKRGQPMFAPLKNDEEPRVAC